MRDGHRKLRALAAAATVAAALALPIGVAAAAESGQPVRGATLGEATSAGPPAPATEAAGTETESTEAGTNEAATGEAKPDAEGDGSTSASDDGVIENSPLAPEGEAVRHPNLPPASGGTTAEEISPAEEELEGAESELEADEAAEKVAAEGGDKAAPALQIPALSASACAAAAVPQELVPIYQRASAQYGLGPQGAAVLAGINAVETGFGTNLGPSSAGAEGWMQFMPSTWSEWGVDANGDGVADPDNPEDAIFSAARYLAAAGMPADTYGAIYAYNHADWYVSEVLADAGCYAAEVGDTSFTAAGLTPQIEVLKCQAAAGWKKQIPAEYLEAFEGAAARYELGKRGVWALAAIARLESNFGRGMSKKQLEVTGPLGLEASEWKQFRVDGDDDGHIRHADIFDSALTLAREIWSKGSLEAGVFAHNQAAWYVEEVMGEAEEIEGGCKTSWVDWRVSPLAAETTVAGAEAVIQPNGLAAAPASAPPAVKAAIAAANSIATTPYVWGGGHASFYSYGYDCSGAVSFALYGAGLLDTPLTSGGLESYGEPGPGKWITIYANAEHTYMVIGGLRWDTVGDANGTGPRWHAEPPYPQGFVVRHPAGY
ncbi:MAG TPA: lytic murein transglycosylase [Solirubrobacterales bacterium]|nr:lytic murein transglycosylase [Solirubrobacterales bacterium]